MITLSIILTFIGFWCFYQKSNRAELAKPNGFEKWIRGHKEQSYIIGLFGLVLGFVFCLFSFGVTSGIFTYLITLTVIASLSIILGPLGYLNRWSISIFFVLALIFETTF
ncbi:hypothetical protein LVD15_00465 [Fulvivirga maritima]|uniref:hypothetical protein n=1 Tax=Fulvivirga maritima TaxID=2904247 RepID=UPI001F1D35D8|nr:hypothetical protein [Fulvivirga maritima]UII26944.1 hypothetical protein LVD15_00465 [Fulvivirga maritima]